MCQTNAIAVAGGREEMLMEGVARLEVEGDTLKLRGIFGDRLELRGRIVEINFQGGKMIIERA